MNSTNYYYKQLVLNITNATTINTSGLMAKLYGVKLITNRLWV